MRTIRFFVLSSSLAVLCASPAMAEAPASLRNKSFTVSWSETHNQSRNGGEFREVSVPYRWTLYISSVGRGFGRLRAGSGEHDSVGKGGSSFGGGARGATFTDSGIVQTANFGEAARRIKVDINGSGCAAQITVGKMPGVDLAKYTRSDGQHFEIRSLQAGSASCQMQEGNAFAH